MIAHGVSPSSVHNNGLFLLLSLIVVTCAKEAAGVAQRRVAYALKQGDNQANRPILAHGYLFSGQYEKAKASYLNYKLMLRTKRSLPFAAPSTGTFVEANRQESRFACASPHGEKQRLFRVSSA
jgi:hypothetical protein